MPECSPEGANFGLHRPPRIPERINAYGKASNVRVVGDSMRRQEWVHIGDMFRLLASFL